MCFFNIYFLFLCCGLCLEWVANKLVSWVFSWTFWLIKLFITENHIAKNIQFLFSQTKGSRIAAVYFFFVLLAWRKAWQKFSSPWLAKRQGWVMAKVTVWCQLPLIFLRMFTTSSNFHLNTQQFSFFCLSSFVQIYFCNSQARYSRHQSKKGKPH